MTTVAEKYGRGLGVAIAALLLGHLIGRQLPDRGDPEPAEVRAESEIPQAPPSKPAPTGSNPGNPTMSDWRLLTLGNPQEALAKLGDSLPKNERNQAAKDFGYGAAQKLGFKAIALIADVPEKGMRNVAMLAAFKVLAEVDPVRTADAFKKHLTGSSMKRAAALTLLPSLAKHAPDRMLDLLSDHGWVNRSGKNFHYNDANSFKGNAHALHAFLTLGVDPQVASTLIEHNRGSAAVQESFTNSLLKLPADAHRDLLIRENLAIWADEDAEGSLRFANAIDDPALRSVALDGILSSRLSYQLGREAREIVAGVNGAKLSDKALEGLTRADPNFAFEYLETIPEGERESATAEIFLEMGDVDGHLGGRLLENSGDPLITRRGARWLMENWLDNDPESATTWAAALEASPTRDGAADRISSYFGNSQPESAFAWSAFISDPELRQQRLAQTAKAWAKKDPQSARAGITSSDRIDDAERKTLLQLIPSP